MCDLCDIVEKAKSPDTSEAKIYYSDGLCVIADSLGDKPDKDGFQPKVVVYRQHLSDPLPPIKDAITQTCKRLFRKRTLWFPQTVDHKDYDVKSTNKLPQKDWSAHWFIIIE